MIKKLFSNLIILSLIVFFLDFSLGRLLRYYYFKETSGLHYRTTYSIDSTKANILIFGSSRANHHYVPEVFKDELNMSYYNTGRDGNAIFYQVALLKSILMRHNPRIILLDYAGGFEKGPEYYDRLSSILPYYRSHKEMRSTIELKSPFERIKLLSEIYPFNSKMLTIIAGNFEKNKSRNADEEGYVPLYDIWNERIESITPEKKYNIDSIKVKAFDEFLILAKKSGAKVYVVYSPIFLKMKHSKEIEICNEVCKLENVPFWDYSKDTIFLNNNQFFYDIQHLNDSGAKVFSKIICNQINTQIN